MGGETHSVPTLDDEAPTKHQKSWTGNGWWGHNRSIMALEPCRPVGLARHILNLFRNGILTYPGELHLDPGLKPRGSAGLYDMFFCSSELGLSPGFNSSGWSHDGAKQLEYGRGW